MAPHLTGKVIGEAGRGSLHKFVSGMFATEMVYSLVIILCSVMIFIATKELYELSNHKGIKYFRFAFLFFAFAFFIRTFIKFLLVQFNVAGVLELAPRFIGQSTAFLFVYCSTMAAFFLLYSLMYKKWKSSYTILSLHAVAILAGIVLAVTRSFEVVLLLNLSILVFILITGFAAHQETKNKKHGLYTVYALLFAFLILNIFDILIPAFLRTLQVFIYLASTTIFLIILYKVLIRTPK